MEDIRGIVGIEHRAAGDAAPLGLIRLHFRQICFIDPVIAVSIPRVRQIAFDLLRKVLQYLLSLERCLFRCQFRVLFISGIIQNPVRLVCVLDKVRIKRYSACRRFGGSADVLIPVLIRPVGEIITVPGRGLGLRHSSACPVAGHYVAVIVLPGHIHHNR